MKVSVDCPALFQGKVGRDFCLPPSFYLLVESCLSCMKKSTIPVPYSPYTLGMIFVGQIRWRLQAFIQHDERQVAVAFWVRLSLISQAELHARIGTWRGGDEPIAHIARLEAKKAPLVQL